MLTLSLPLSLSLYFLFFTATVLYCQVSVY
jgi:hypothetical protein